jgi:hypothetical protein
MDNGENSHYAYVQKSLGVDYVPTPDFIYEYGEKPSFGWLLRQLVDVTYTNIKHTINNFTCLGYVPDAKPENLLARHFEKFTGIARTIDDATDATDDIVMNHAKYVDARFVERIIYSDNEDSDEGWLGIKGTPQKTLIVANPDDEDRESATYAWVGTLPKHVYTDDDEKLLDKEMQRLIDGEPKSTLTWDWMNSQNEKVESRRKNVPMSNPQPKPKAMKNPDAEFMSESEEGQSGLIKMILIDEMIKDAISQEQ